MVGTCNFDFLFVTFMIGINLALTEEQAKINLKVEAKVKEIVNKLKMSHAKFEDPDFGPLESDEFGAKSLYGAAPPDPAGSKYPSPESLMWQRPQYDDNHFSNGKTGEEDEEEDIEEDEDDDDEYGFKGESNDVEVMVHCPVVSTLDLTFCRFGASMVICFWTVVPPVM